MARLKKVAELELYKDEYRERKYEDQNFMLFCKKNHLGEFTIDPDSEDYKEALELYDNFIGDPFLTQRKIEKLISHDLFQNHDFHER